MTGLWVPHAARMTSHGSAIATAAVFFSFDIGEQDVSHVRLGYRLLTNLA
jgi:hypothetical protein